MDKHDSGCVAGRVFLDDMSRWMGGARKAEGLPLCGWASSNQVRFEEVGEGERRGKSPST